MIGAIVRAAWVAVVAVVRCALICLHYMALAIVKITAGAVDRKPPTRKVRK